MKIVLMAAISADGKIARSEEDTSTDWTSRADTKFFVEKTKQVGVVIFGRKTFETFNKALPGRRTIVMTGSPERYSVDGVEFTSEDPNELISRLQKEEIDEVVVGGGAGVYSQFLSTGLVDEVFLTVEPQLFGRGVVLCELDKTLDMELEDVRRLGQQSALFHYSIKRG